MLTKLKFTHKTAMLDIVNKGTETIIFKPEDREQVEQKESYPWLDSSVKRKYMTDLEILDK